MCGNLVQYISLCFAGRRDGGVWNLPAGHYSGQRPPSPGSGCSRQIQPVADQIDSPQTAAGENGARRTDGFVLSEEGEAESDPQGHGAHLASVGTCGVLGVLCRRSHSAPSNDDIREVSSHG